MKTLLYKYCFSFLAIILFIPIVQAQLFPARQYTAANELANSNIYDITHDARGYLWFATERGVSRFDGFKFTNYLFKEGIDGSIVYALAESDKGEFFAATKYNGVFKFGNNFKKVINENVSLQNEQIAIAGNYFYSLKKGQYVSVVDLKNPGVVTKLQFEDQNIIPNFIIKAGGDTIFIGTNKGIYSVKAHQIPKSINKTFTKEIFSICVNKNTIYAGGDGVYYILENNVITENKLNLGGIINRLLADRYGNIWCATFPQNNLILISKGLETDISSKLGINGISVNKIFEDAEGNIWLGTYGKGAFCIHHLYCSNFTNSDGLVNEYITALETDPEGNLFIGSYDGLYYLKNNIIKQQKLFPGTLEFIRGIEVNDHHLFVNIAGFKNPGLNLTTTNLNGIEQTYLLASSSMISNNTIYYSKWDKKLWSAPVTDGKIGNGTVMFYDSTAVWRRINALFQDKKNNIWIGTTHGLYILDPSGKYQKIDTGFYSTNISKFMYDGDNNILIGTDHGLVKYKNGSFQTFKSLKGRNIENITSFEMDANNRIWIGTLAGLYIMDDDAIMQFDTRNGLLSDEINALEYDEKNNYIWIGTTFGMSRIDIDAFNKTKFNAPAAIFKSIRTPDSIYRNMENQTDVFLPYTTTNFTIRFSAIHFSAPEGIKFQYKFDDAEWQPSVGRQIEFASIPYGKHILYLKSIGERDLEGPIAKLNITVQTPFWATSWFKILVGFIIALSAYLILRWQFEAVRKKQQEKLELQSKISELRHQALAASMNPHFIFNALNSIQHFINAHNTEEATEYLGKFARLIRMMLDSGGKTFVPLSEELERLNYYLELEKVRFGNKLNYKISVDETLLNEEIEIPNMVIQPLVENALWHGLLTTNRNGDLNVSFEKLNGSIKVLVDDNGIGINESKKRKKSGHNSLGIQMIRERLELLNKLSGYQANIIIHDKSDFNPDDHGTLVQVNLM